MKKLDAIVYVGRFQPFTNAHYKILKMALEKAKKVILFIGSADRSRSFRDPWTAQERQDMISSIKEFKDKNIVYIHQRNSNYKKSWWVKEVKRKVNKFTEQNAKIGIIGFEKDASSYYLKLFPEWKFIKVHELENGLSATEERIHYFTNFYTTKREQNLPTEIIIWLTEWKCKFNGVYQYLVEEFKSILNYIDSWKQAPYKPTFVTADALCLCKDNILLVTRKNHPGKDLFAMPGGFLDQKELIVDCCIRELKEETHINVGSEIIKKSIKLYKYFDDPYRDPRGRGITHCYLIDLKSKKLPKIVGGDDACNAQWVPISSLNVYRNCFFDDHYQIIKNMLEKYRRLK